MSMRILAALLVGSCVWLMNAHAEPVKETNAAQATRKKLKTKIDLTVKNEMLRDIFNEISGQLTDAKAGALSVTTDTGVSSNSRATITAKQKPLEDVLDELLKPLDLGYVVISKAGDRYDGWLLLKKGNERGEEAGKAKAEDGKEKKKEMAKKEDPKTKKGDGDEEKTAEKKLNNAKTYFSLKKADKAKEILEGILKDHPDTKAAEEAKKLLEKQ
jgi:hypothetical protein